MLVEIIEMQPPTDWFDANAYPGDGLYRHSGSLFSVNGVIVNSTTLDIPPASVRPEQPEQKGNVSESLLLRVIAVSRDPSLAGSIDVTER